MPSSFIDEIEVIVEEVSTWGAEYVSTIIEALAPDGRPFGMEELTEEEQVDDYLQIRSSTEAWTKWVNDRTLNIIQRLTIAGVSDEQIFTVKPFDIAEQMALAYSVRMEGLLIDA